MMLIFVNHFVKKMLMLMALPGFTHDGRILPGELLAPCIVVR